MDAVKWVEDKIIASRGSTDVHLVVEIYTVNAHTVRHSRQYDALEVIGCCRYLSEVYNIHFDMQSPASRKVVTEDALKQLGWHRPSKDKHSIDASRHLALKLLKLGVLKPEEVR